MSTILTHQGTLPTLTEPRGLTIDLLQRSVPAIFAESPDSRVSAGYSFIPTRPLLEAIVDQGWTITGAQNQLTGRGRGASVKPFGAHLLRFRRSDLDITRDDLKDGYPEIVLLNSHDRTKRYQLMAGIFRMVCSNGLIVMNDTIGRTTLTHYNIKQTMEELLNGARVLAERTGMVTDKMTAMRNRELTVEEQTEFAQKAIDIRYRGYSTALTPAMLIENVRRPQDEGANLWNVFNRVQEHLAVGGLSTGRAHTRPMASLFEGVSTNVKLWSLAEELLARN